MAMSFPKKDEACFDESIFAGSAPFAPSPTTNLQFREGVPLLVHSTFLRLYPKLSVNTLNNVSQSAGHVLVNYLYTGTYQTLKWRGPATGDEEAVAKLKIGFEVYATARRFELGGLEELAKEEITRLSETLDGLSLISVISEVHPVPYGQDTWLPFFLKGAIKAAFKRSMAIAKSEGQDSGESERWGLSIAKNIFEAALEAHREILDASSIAASPTRLQREGNETENQRPAALLMPAPNEEEDDESDVDSLKPLEATTYVWKSSSTEAAAKPIPAVGGLFSNNGATNVAAKPGGGLSPAMAATMLVPETTTGAADDIATPVIPGFSTFLADSTTLATIKSLSAARALRSSSSAAPTLPKPASDYYIPGINTRPFAPTILPDSGNIGLFGRPQKHALHDAAVGQVFKRRAAAGNGGDTQTGAGVFGGSGGNSLSKQETGFNWE
ncbi:hypothetical protein OQA88_5846 [Cercophora sp. LCS_1]